MNTEFTNWLVEELQKRGWTQSEFARRAGITAPTVSRVLSGDNNPGEEFARGVGRAFGMPVESVLRLVGKLPEAVEMLPEAREWSARLLELNPDRRAVAIQAIENVLLLAENRS